ncbi:hypothetical protein [Paenibacillus amylolyticus]|uniref:hypothetical protein n=1 Tax=Paenibacillus amylolyticus TaxID=1451 RepID=UPI003EBDB40C
MSNRVPYSYLELEYIEREYDEQVPLRVIAENVNEEFHAASLVRTPASISYAVNRYYNDSEWVSRLEEKWLSEVSADDKRSQNG